MSSFFTLHPSLQLNRSVIRLVFLATLLISFLSSVRVTGQTPGLIVKPAVGGRSVLDFDNNGYVSISPSGFVSSDQTESEIPFKRLSLPEAEPTSDLANGPSCGFTDFVDATNIDPVSSYLDAANNLIFRFRLGGYAPNSKGYSILIDTDNRFGNTGANADPDYISGNPGFEVEIELVTNFGVRLYDVNGKNGTTLAGSDLKVTLPYDDYAQKSIALTMNCGNPDYFYDFYMPFSVITTYFPSFTPTTPVRMVANTVISTQSVLRGPISDMGGINDNNYGGDYMRAWTAAISSSVPTPMSTIGSGGSYPPIRSATPTVNGPIAANSTSVSGTSTEPNGTIIRVYVNGVSVGTTTVTGGSWTLSGLTALAATSSVTATATALNKSESQLSSAVVVIGKCSNPSNPPSISCISDKGVEVTGPVGAPAGTTIRIYNRNGLVATGTTNASNIFLFKCNGSTTNCTSGGTCGTPVSGVYWATAEEAGKCESYYSTEACQSTAGTPVAPVITTNPITTAMTSVSGTATSGAFIILYNGTNNIGSTTAAGTNWTITGLSLYSGQTLTAKEVSGTRCLSSASNSVIVTNPTAAPVVNGPIYNGATSVTGTSTEPAGTVITVYRGGASIGTTTVDAFGSWTLNGTPALLTGNTITATAAATGKTASTVSNTVTVQVAPTPLPATTEIPTITGTYQEGGTSVSGTSTAPSGTIINVYIDKVLIGTTTVLPGGTWSLTGLSAAFYDLYAGGVLNATATRTGQAESAYSNDAVVACLPPLDKTINALSTQICSSTTAQIRVVNSEAGVIYTLKTAGSNASASLLGTGSDIVFTSIPFTANQVVELQALKIPLASCNTISPSTATVTVNQPPPTSNTVTFSPVVGPGKQATFNVENTTSGFQYQLRDNSNNANVGSMVTSMANGSTVSLNSDPSFADKTYYILVTDATRPTNCSSRLATNYFVPLPIDLLYFNAFAREPGKVLLTWATASEKNSDAFIVERSNDGAAFTAVHTQKAAGNAARTTTYQYADYINLTGKVYYRLKQIDQDSTFSYSKTVMVNLSQTASTTLHISPNPANEYVDLQFEADKPEKITVVLASISGKKVFTADYTTSKGSNTIHLGVQSLKPGMYSVKVVGTNWTLVSKVEKVQ